MVSKAYVIGRVNGFHFSPRNFRFLASVKNYSEWCFAALRPLPCPMEVPFPRKVTVVSNRWILHSGRRRLQFRFFFFCYNIHYSYIQVMFCLQNIPVRKGTLWYVVRPKMLAATFIKSSCVQEKVNFPFLPLGNITFEQCTRIHLQNLLLYQTWKAHRNEQHCSDPGILNMQILSCNWVNRGSHWGPRLLIHALFQKLHFSAPLCFKCSG